MHTESSFSSYQDFATIPYYELYKSSRNFQRSFKMRFNINLPLRKKNSSTYFGLSGSPDSFVVYVSELSSSYFMNCSPHLLQLFIPTCQVLASCFVMKL